MGNHDTQQVCLKGHQITARYHSSPQFRKKFCAKCGAETIHKCPECNYAIPGEFINSGVLVLGASTPIPTHCTNCGKPFPWADLKSKIAKSSTKSEAIDPLALVEQICGRFHLVVRQIKSRYDNRETLNVSDEYDVQDLLHALLHVYFDDIRREEWTPSYAGGSSRVDFLLKDEKIIIEVKKTRSTLKARDVGEQLLIDMQRYRVHPDCKKLVCFVYDPEGWLSNPIGLENDLSRTDGDFQVKTLIVPKGH